MSIVIGVLATVLIAAGLVAAFLRTDAANLASALRAVVPVALGSVGLILVVLGRAGIGGLLLVVAMGWALVGLRRGKAAAPTPVKRDRSTVRTAALEMELDHRTGALEGLVLAGRHESKTLGKLKLAQLLELYRDLYSDAESRQLLETYLDGRFPVWREHAKADGGNGHGVAPGASAMTKEEAYKVLGLEAGATATDIRKAHRRLMQRLHPDIGGTSVLAARINEAKDVLLSNHG